MSVVQLPGQPKRRGRPSKRTPDVEHALCEALKVGAPIRIACGYAGIDEATYHRWNERFPDFREATTRARYGQAVRNLALIQKAAPQDYRAALEALRMSFPAEFAKRLEISTEERVKIAEEQATALGEALIAALSDLDEDTQERVRVALRRLSA